MAPAGSRKGREARHVKRSADRLAHEHALVAAGVTLAGSIAAFVLLPDHPTITEDA